MTELSERGPDIGAVVIGRNEGERLRRCLASLSGQTGRIVYVDSGSTDGSQDWARDNGAEVVDLDTSVPFTAARARNAGFRHLADGGTAPEFVQFVDGDCELAPGWLSAAHAFLADTPQVAVVCGRRRERFPDASLWNRLCDMEWDTPVGEAKACGGDALMRSAAFQESGGFNPGLIAGEEPELCLRLRAAGWKIWRLDAEMTLHDAALHRFGQWWTRARRAGHAYAEGAAMHGAPPERHKVKETRSALFWGFLLPLVSVFGAAFTPWALALLSAFPMQILRLRARGTDWVRPVFLTLGKFPEAQGVIEYWFRRLSHRPARLIEYK